MKVHVYVEGPADKNALEKLLSDLIESKKSHGVHISFFPNTKGDAKKELLWKIPVKAADFLKGNTGDFVVVLPDLYPKNKGFPHEKPEELFRGINENFKKALEAKNVQNPDILKERFKTFCFKHDMEVLLLAAEEELKDRLGISDMRITWKKPVEDQDHDNPPKKVVEKLFSGAGKKYHGTVDAPVILNGTDYNEIANRCPQCFKPFVEFLESL